MFYIDLEFEDIRICSVEKEDLSGIYAWITHEEDSLEESQFYERFLEYYLSECEFFLKINKNNNLIGVIKGKVEFKNPNEVWIRYFSLDSKERNRGLGSKILRNIIKYFFMDCSIWNFYAEIKEVNSESLIFWKKNGFHPGKPFELKKKKGVIVINTINQV